MVFFRVKKIKGNEYVYAVENEWSRNGSRQKVKGYVGRAYRFGMQNDVEFLQYLKVQDAATYAESNDKNRIIEDLVKWEFFRFGIGKEFIANGLKIQKDNKNTVLLINDGYMSTLTLGSLTGFKPENEDTDGYRFARAFVEAGIKVPQKVFVELFSKLTKN